MTNEYIVSIFNYDLSEKLYDGIVKLEYNSYGNYIEISTDNLIIFRRLINSNLNSSFLDNIFKINESYHQISIKFDDNSSESFNNFKTNIIKLKNTKCSNKYYSNGNLKYTGTFCNDIPNGKISEFYNTPYNMLKYHGEMNNGNYDGEGTFYSQDKMLKLHCNNINCNKLTGICKFTILAKKRIDKKFYYQNLTTTEPLSSSNLCYNIGIELFNDLTEIINKNLPIEKRLDKLYNDTKLIHEKLKILSIMNKYILTLYYLQYFIIICMIIYFIM
tara:strand:+ start:728 stop:1549 length:822 start_codon:yes stop_codon:yes gene_type:complete